MGIESSELLILLGELGAAEGKKHVTLRELAEKLGASPQTILRTLNRLADRGLVDKSVEGGKTYVEITDTGLRFLESLHERLERILYNGLIVGEVVSGLGEGSYYVKLYSERFREYLGFEPYPGTLNVKTIFPKTVFDALCGIRPIIVPGFVKDGRTFGDVRAYPAEINGISAAIVVPSRTVHPPRIAEIIAPVNLREKLGLKDGDRVRIKVLGKWKE